MDILERLSPHHRSRKSGSVISAIIIHDTGGKTAESALSWFERPGSGVSSHYVIGKDGVVFRCVPEDRAAWHAGVSSLFGKEQVNEFSIGLEIVDDNDADRYPDAQLTAVVELTADLCKRYGIPLNRVVGHQHIAPGRKVDPGPDFPWEVFLLKVATLLIT